MSDAAKDIRVNYISTDVVVDTGVSCDGTWQKRGFSSFNGVFAAISMDNVEAMIRSCKVCCLKKN